MKHGGPSGPIRLYVNATAGWTVFWTSSSADGQNGDPAAFQSTNQHGNLFTSAVKGGVRIPVGEGIRLDLNARRTATGGRDTSRATVSAMARTHGRWSASAT